MRWEEFQRRERHVVMTVCTLVHRLPGYQRDHKRTTYQNGPMDLNIGLIYNLRGLDGIGGRAQAGLMKGSADRENISSTGKNWCWIS